MWLPRSCRHRCVGGVFISIPDSEVAISFLYDRHVFAEMFGVGGVLFPVYYNPQFGSVANALCG